MTFVFVIDPFRLDLVFTLLLLAQDLLVCLVLLLLCSGLRISIALTHN